MSAGHGHADVRTGAGRHAKPLAWTLALTGSFLLIEIAAGIWTHSLALLADAGHMFTDVAGLAMALTAIRFAAKPATASKTYGYYRVEILAALANALALLFISLYILYEAYRRFLAPPDVLAGPMLAVAVVGLLVNAVGVWLLRGGSAESLNVKGAYFEVLSDALGSVGVIVGALVVLLTGWQLADPVIAAGIGLFILPRTWGLLTQAVNILLEAAPAHLDVEAIERAMREVSGVTEVHDLHIWTLTSGRYAMSGHARVSQGSDVARVLRDLERLLHERFDVHHTTIQVEPTSLMQISDRPPERRDTPEQERPPL